MKKLILALALAATFTNCSITYTKKLELKQENKTTLASYLDERKVNYDIKDLATLDHINSWIHFNDNKLLMVPHAIFFNKYGARITENFNEQKCSAAINGIEDINNYAADTNDNLNKWLADYITFPFTEETIFTEEYDGYVLLLYGKFAGKSSNAATFNWYRSIREDKSIKLRPILLNIDLQDNWEMSAEQKKALGLEK